MNWFNHHIIDFLGTNQTFVIYLTKDSHAQVRKSHKNFFHDNSILQFVFEKYFLICKCTSITFEWQVQTDNAYKLNTKRKDYEMICQNVDQSQMQNLSDMHVITLLTTFYEIK